MDFDFKAIGLVLAGISFGLIGVFMAGGMLWPEQAEKAKKQVTLVIQGLIILGIGSILLAAFGG